VARPRPAARFQQLRDAALLVFGTQGLRRSRMADVAAEMKVSPGSLYNYVESKEALFHWILERGGDEGPVEAPTDLPIRTPARDEVHTRLRAQLEAAFRLPRFEAALARRRVTDAGAELEEVVRELFERIERHRRTMTVIERSAIDLPALFQIYFVTLRRDFFGRFAHYVERRQASGHFRDDVDPVVAARGATETVTYFARHRFGDQDPDTLPNDDAVRENVVPLVVGSLLAPTPRPRRRSP
jgi:AcrR family transcriptional regulator